MLKVYASLDPKILTLGDDDYIISTMDLCNKVMINYAQISLISSQLIHNIHRIEINTFVNSIYLYDITNNMISVIDLDITIDYEINITSFCPDGMKLCIRALERKENK